MKKVCRECGEKYSIEHEDLDIFEKCNECIKKTRDEK